MVTYLRRRLWKDNQLWWYDLKRFIRLKEFTPNSSLKFIPSDNYLKKTNGSLKQKEYSIIVNENGFYESLIGEKNTDNIIIIGDSFVENLYSDEASRIINHITHDSGKVYNAGYSGCNTLHIINSIMNKIIFNDSIKLIIYIKPVNDIDTLEKKGGFFNIDKRYSNIISSSESNNTEITSEIKNDNSEYVIYKILFDICRNAGKNLVCFLTHYNKNYNEVYGLSLKKYTSIIEKIELSNKKFYELAKYENIPCYFIDNICLEEENWYDFIHLNDTGSIHFGEAISKKIEDSFKGMKNK